MVKRFEFVPRNFSLMSSRSEIGWYPEQINLGNMFPQQSRNLE